MTPDEEVDSLLKKVIDFEWYKKKIDQEQTKKLEKDYDDITLKHMGEIAEIRRAHKSETLSIGILILSIGISFIITGINSSPQNPIQFLISFPNAFFWYIPGFIAILFGIRVYKVAFYNFEMCNKIILKSKKDK